MRDTNSDYKVAGSSRRPAPRPVADEIRVRSLRTLSLVLPLMAAVYAANGILYLTAPPFEPARPIILASVLFAGLSLLAWAGLKTDEPKLDTPMTLVTIAIAAGYALTLMWLTAEPVLGAALAIIAVAAGGLLYRLSMYAVLAAVSLVGWWLLARDYDPTDHRVWAFYLTSAVATGFMVLWSRRNLTLSLHEQAYQAEMVSQLASDQAAKLARARDAALASAQTKGEFLANVSHEIRTPLNGILGLLQLIEHTSLPEQQQLYLRDAEKSGFALLAIVNDILDLSKIDAGGMQLEVVPFNVQSVVQEVVGNHAAAAAAKGIELVTQLDEQVPEDALGDPLRLRQVITNLIGNAIKFTHAGKIVVSVRTLSRVAAYADIEFRVSDTGVGIPIAQQQKIFRAFSQADASTTREFGGTGLGLTISRQLVELMGGSLQVRSVEHEGSSFFFVIRLQLEEQLSHELRAVTQGLEGLHALIFEGNLRTRDTLANQFSGWGMKPRTAANFRSAVKSLKTEPFPDVALVDLDAMGNDWEDEASRFVASAAKRRCALVAMGSAAQDWNLSSEVGMRVHLTKPVRRAAAIEALLEALNKPIPKRFLLTDTQIRTAPRRMEASKEPNGHRVLVAEDNDVNRMVAMAHLQALGYAVDTVNDGAAALQALGPDHGYSAVIMDGQMPNLDGYQATTALRRIEQERGSARVPVIALTAHAMEGDRDTALHAGMDEYISKPFTRAQLGDVLQKCIGTHKSKAPRSVDRTSQTQPILDTAIAKQLLELEEDRPGFLGEVVDGFVQSAEEHLVAIRRAAAEGDLDTVKRRAHTIKGGSQQLGVQRFGVSCRALEVMESLDDAELALQNLEREFREAKAALTNLVAESLSTS